jgi:tetratricopeptide (TPR) repeat protein
MQFTIRQFIIVQCTFIPVACAVLVLAGCAAPAVKPSTTDVSAAEATSKPPVAVRVMPVAAPAKPRNLPAQELDDDKLYAFLVGEIANQRGFGAVATEAYMDLAKSTRDPRIAERATQIALASKQLPKALAAAQLWKELEPEAANASQTVTALLVSQGKLSEAAAPLKSLLASEGADAGHTFMQINALLAKQTDKAGVLKLVREVAADYPQFPEAHFAIAQAAMGTKQFDVAKSETDAALKLRPGWEQAALLHVDALRQPIAKPAAAIAYLKKFVADYPAAREARLSLAQLYASDKNFPAARTEFEGILSGASNNPDLTVAIALLLFQNGDTEGAEKYFKQAKTLQYKEPDLIQAYLAQLYEDSKRYDDAIRAYKEVGRGEQYFPAQLKVAMLLGKQNKLEDGRAYLKSLMPETSEQRTQIVLADASLLRDAKRYAEAYEVLSTALKEQPDSQDLLYERAMTAEKLEKLDVLEQDLRRLIQVAPEYAHAYNALGYTLADRTTRFQEALTLIEKAHSLSPDDPFIQDSLGWVHFRMGDLEKGAALLKDAYAKKPDAEIAAHLGEVLWAQGARDEALKLWHTSLKNNPGNESLEAVLKKFKK